MTDAKEIANRTFRSRDGAEVTVVIHAPEPHEGDWRSLVRVAGLGEESDVYVFGVDSLQAYALALRMAEARIKALQRAHGLTWEGEDDLMPDLLL